MGDQGGDKRREGGGGRGGGRGGRGGAGRGKKGPPRGQATKRKTDVDFKDAHSTVSELAPPPVGRDIMAIPAKLRRIMELKNAVASGEKHNPNAYKRQRSEGSKASEKKKDKKRKLNDKENSKSSEGDEDKNDAAAAKKTKLSRAEEEIKMLNARFDRKAGVKPKSTGEKWKSYLNEKKKKKKRGKNSIEEGLPEMHKHEKIAFGEVVQAPPKLTFPQKAAKIKEKEKGNGDQTLLRERLRLQAIESYRQRKKWAERPGQKLPSLDNGVAVPDLLS
ncbi:hypothetical protein R1sor_025250 [Riccia sorocarpa]|uniref:Coiled-coil domain-containing protein 137 n=1 Tax=Riccia sorocarpa TaxID=122646 RepID=A0ABD3G820_9MARC